MVWNLKFLIYIFKVVKLNWNNYGKKNFMGIDISYLRNMIF